GRASTESRVTVTQQLARGRARALILAEGLDPVYDDRPITLGPLHPPPFTAREIVDDFASPFWLNVEAIEVVHDHVGICTIAQHATVAESSGMRRERRHAIVRLFQSYLLLVAHQPSQEVGGEGASSQELGVSTTIRHAGECIQ